MSVFKNSIINKLCYSEFSFQYCNFITCLIWTIVFQIRDVEHDWVVDVGIRILVAVHSVLRNGVAKVVCIGLTLLNLTFFNYSTFVLLVLLYRSEAPFLIGFLCDLSTKLRIDYMISKWIRSSSTRCVVEAES